jgi:DEAD/DEAH box helicase domain-containing protein
MSYRGGYAPSQRRAIERDLFSNRLRGVTATNALEVCLNGQKSYPIIF